MAFRSLISAAVVLLVFAARPAAGASLADLSGMNVVEVRIQGAEIPESEKSELVPQAEGEPLVPEAVRDGVLNLYRTGRFKRADVFAGESEAGVILVFRVVQRQYLSEIVFDGNLYIGDGDLLRRTDLSLREEVSDLKLRQNAARVREYYVHRGFTECEVAFRVEPDGRGKNRVVFQVREGAAATVSDVRLEGEAGLSRTQLLALIASMPGERLDGRVLLKDVERVQGHLRENFFLSPRVKYSLAPDPRFPGGVIVTFLVERGPLFILEVRTPDTGEGKWVRKRVEKEFKKASSVEVAKAQAEKQVLSRFRQKGHPFAAIQWEEDSPGESQRSISMTLQAGPPVSIGSIRIAGVGRLNEDEALRILGLESGEPFVQADLEQGVSDLGKYYYEEGFLEAEVLVDPLDFVPSGDGQEVRIGITVQEGEQSLIGNLEVRSDLKGAVFYTEMTGLGAGDPYVPESVEEAREKILAWLSGAGYLYANVSISEPVRDENNMVSVVLNVDEGPMVRLGSVVITGNERVDSGIIRLALDLDRGDVLTQEKILRGQERIYRLGVMNSVDIRMADSQSPSDRKDLVVSVKERPRYVIGFRLGYGSEDKVRGEASVTHKNLGGMARSLTLKGKESALERRTTLLYHHPWFTSRPVDMSASLSDIIEEKGSYSRDALSASLDFTRRMSEKTQAGLGYVFEGLRLFDVSPGAQLSPDDEGKIDVAAVIWDVTYDSRDDLLDPWSGLLGDFRLETGFRGLGSAAEYVKVELASHKYIHLGGRTVLAGLFRLGSVTPYGLSEEVIISKRFFLGGQNSVRGYVLDSLGPKDEDGEPVGGNFMFNGNVEIRFPLLGSVRGVGFLDSGSVWLRTGEYGFHLLSSLGAGLRWSSPIGPLSLDYGYKINPDPEDLEDRYRWHLSIGHAF